MVIKADYKPIISELIMQLKACVGSALNSVWLVKDRNADNSKYAPIFTVQCVIDGDDKDALSWLNTVCNITDNVMSTTEWFATANSVSKDRFNCVSIRDAYYIDIRKRGTRVYGK